MDRITTVYLLNILAFTNVFFYNLGCLCLEMSKADTGCSYDWEITAIGKLVVYWKHSIAFVVLANGNGSDGSALVCFGMT